MDITTIDPISYATRVGAVAAAELYGLLADQALPPPNWFNQTSRPTVPDDESAHGAWLDELSDQVGKLGEYVCINQVDQGERLYRWGGSRGIVPLGDWGQLDTADRQAFEIFVVTVRHSYLGLAVAQKALEDARLAAGVKSPGLKLEDSIFEKEEPLGTLRPEAIASAQLLDRYTREHQAAQPQVAEEKAAQEEQERRKAVGERLKAARAAKRAQKPDPLSAGETIVAGKPNQGGRPRKPKP